MRVRWERIVGFMLILTGIYLALKLRSLLVNIFEIANEPFGYDSPIKAIKGQRERLMGMAASLG